MANFFATVTDLTAQFNDFTLGGATSYSWNFGDGSPVSSQLNPSHTYSAPGTYTVVLTVSDGNCSSSFEQIIVVGSVGVNDLSTGAAWAVYPNPADDNVTLEFDRALVENARIEIRDEAGKLMFAQVVPAASKLIQVPTSTLAQGVYTIRVIAARGTAVRKLTIIRAEE